MKKEEDKEMSGKRWAALGIAAVLFFFSVAINTLTAFLSKDFQQAVEEFMDRIKADITME